MLGRQIEQAIAHFSLITKVAIKKILVNRIREAAQEKKVMKMGMPVAMLSQKVPRTTTQQPQQKT
jgi:hypothetical protein